VKSSYENLTLVDVDFIMVINHVLWLKMISLKFNIFIWRILLNRLPTKDLLVRCRVLVVSDNTCSADCGFSEDRDNLFLTCKVFGTLWLSISGWLGISTVFHGNI